MEEGCFSYCGSTHLPPPTIHHHHSAVVSRAKHSNSVGISWLHVFRMRNLYTRKIQSRIKLLSLNSHVCAWIWSKQCTSTLHTHTSYTSCINICIIASWGELQSWQASQITSCHTPPSTSRIHRSLKISIL